MALGLLASALICFSLGFTTSFIVFTGLWGLNGWFQSMGAPPSIVAITRWFGGKERGTFYGFWSASHNIGESITIIVVAFIITTTGLQWGFWGAGLFGVLGTVIIFSFLHERPESKEVYFPKNNTSGQNDKTTVSGQQLKVLKNPYIWILALSSSLMYVSRYAVNSWGIFYLENAKGFSIVEASSIVSISSICGIVGIVLSGVISDKIFHGNVTSPKNRTV